MPSSTCPHQFRHQRHSLKSELCDLDREKRFLCQLFAFTLQESVPFVFVGTVEAIVNAKLLLNFHIDHLKVSICCSARSLLVPGKFVLCSSRLTCLFAGI